MNNTALNTIVLFFTIIAATSGTIVWVDTRIDNKIVESTTTTEEIHKKISEQAQFNFIETSIKLNENTLLIFDMIPDKTPEQQRRYDLLVDELADFKKDRRDLTGMAE